ncbi:MAG: SDR family NAD(P)-dependent oxidoreductase [Candidatus Levybacteria bacterium]|nr:SDR family NAD(P)-dependent oxidoreductase [Candidatus Levybacteria bacterium]
MQTVIVAGGAGFIGVHLCESLLSDGYKIICVDNFFTSKEEKLKDLRNNPNFSFINHDVTKPLEINEKIDYIFHLASPASPNHHSKISYHALPEETMEANTTGTFNLLRLAEKNNATFLFASTSEVYGDPKENPQNENYRGNVSTTGPRSVYDEAKRFGETITAYFGRDKGVDVRIARIFNTFGPGMLPEDMRMIIVFITQALRNEPISMFGDGSQTRSLCYVSDTVEGLKKFMFTPNLKGEVINIGSNDEHSVREFASLIKEKSGSSSEIVESEELPKDDPLARKPDIEKAKRLLGWSPKVPLEDGVSKTIQYFNSL